MTNIHTNINVEFTGQIHNISDLKRQLSVSSNNLNELLQAGWYRWGTKLAEHIVGDFSLVIEDNAQRLTYLVRDALGVKPLYYRIDNAKISWGSSIPQLQSRCKLPATKDIDWAASYLLHLSSSQTETAYKEIKKLAPGHWLTYTNDGKIKVQRYHVWRDDSPFATKRDKRWVDDYQAVLEEAIRCRMDHDAPMGTENSGGIDSATITAYLAQFLGEPGDRLHSFGFAMCELEPAFILETSQAKNIRHNYIITGQLSSDYQQSNIEKSLTILGYPEEHGNASGHVPFYEECQKRGIRTLHSGFGGDEVVTNNGMHLRRELVDGGHYAALWNILPGDPISRSVRLIKALTLGRQTKGHNPLFLKAWNERWPHQLLRPEVVERLNLYEQYMETAIYDKPYRRTNDFILQYHLTKMQLTTRLENCTVMAAAYGVDYRWPLWDSRLVQQYLSTPSIEKVGPKGIGRYLHRRAIDGIVPKRVAWKPTKDMGYGQLLNKMKKSGILKVAHTARELEANLHPGLKDLIDTNKFKQQMTQASKGQADDGFTFGFSRATNALQHLNTWFKL